ncbi:Chemotaxis protein [alpha proteobacterium BAL199]|jgi:chemotaxis protein CheZ|nr:Chemotaxis protein [alpha proteobacterium BAL199]
MTVDTAASTSERARAEIEAIDSELQLAFDRILGAAERVAVAAETLGVEHASSIQAALTDIFEASSVRDIAGQRLSAVRQAVDHLTDGETASQSRPERKRDKSSKIEEKQDHGSASESGLLNGPQLPGAARTQTEVDALFDKLD